MPAKKITGVGEVGGWGGGGGGDPLLFRLLERGAPRLEALKKHAYQNP